MTDPIAFTSATPRFALPLLFAAQAQKETFVNEAHVLTDALLHPLVLGLAATEPADPASGDCWLVDAGATSAFSGHENDLACFFDGQWLFATPRDGMKVFDTNASQYWIFRGGWVTTPTVAGPTGGSRADQEARDAINDLITALQTHGILPPA